MTDKPNSRRNPLVRPNPISGFPEYSPEVCLELHQRLQAVAKLFASHGYTPIQTPIVERLEILQAKGGDVDKEIYTLGRAAQSDGTDAELALRYDLTVPLARYVAAHFGEITFPFKRSHIGDCWRGERPQDGRYRQFKQADIDVISINTLPLSFDADIPLIANEAIRTMGVTDHVFRVSNRKILSGALSALNVAKPQAVTRVLDKLEKIGRAEVARLLADNLGVSSTDCDLLLSLAQITSHDTEFTEQVRALNLKHDLLDVGLRELEYVVSRAQASGASEFLVDLSITRGFDYYTGTVYEVQWRSQPHLGSIAAGGRYDDLSSNYIRKRLPGVGMSVGISRIFGKLVQTSAIAPSKKTTTDVLIVWDRASSEKSLQDIARQLRARGQCVEVYHSATKLAKQVQYADRKGIRFVVFPRFNEFKDLRTGDQALFNVETFNQK